MLRRLLAATVVLCASFAASVQAAPPDKPVDKGPYTPSANGAYQGGGVVLQGAPGAPAPMPQPTPPGQAPANSVPGK